MNGARLWSVVVVLVFPSYAVAQQPVTLNEVLQQALAANARLPVAALNVDIARARVSEARGQLFPQLFVDGDVHDGAPQQYASGDARLQVIGAATLYDGGALRAARDVAQLQVHSADAGYRMAERDVALEVRLRFAEYEQAEQEITFRRAGIDRLDRYLTEITARQAAGQGLQSDVLKTQVQLRTEQADIAAAEARLEDTRLQLNDLMGRAPDAPLALAPLPAPAPPPAAQGEPWRQTPDVVQAQVDSAAAATAIGITRAERRPQLSVTANLGAQPTFGDTTAGSFLNTGRGLGAEVTLSLTLPIWDMGIYRSRLAQAELAAKQAGQSVTVVLRESRLAWQRATTQLNRLYGEVQTRAGTVPTARDSYLLAESMYTGGAATALDVLDAYTSWIDANQAYTDAVLRYRQAEAQYIRWGTP